MDQTPKPPAQVTQAYYDANYRNFHNHLYEQIRREAFGEDIGQNSWLTAAEQDKFCGWLQLAPGKRALDVACGAGGPALRLAQMSGASVIGIDVHEKAIATANGLAAERGLTHLAEFRTVDAGGQLPFPDSSFDAIICIDAINHFPDRKRVIVDWVRLLKADGRLLFTDAIVLTGALTNQEIAVRSSAGFYLFVPPGYDEEILTQCGLRIVESEDVTHNTAEIAERRRLARASREADLRKIEGDKVFEAQQEYLAVAARIARERRLSRFVYVAEKAAL